MVAILKDMGINDFEPRVINQMLEFSYRFAVCWSCRLFFLMTPLKICHWHPGRCQGLLQPRQKESSGHWGRETSSPACRGAGRFLEKSGFNIFNLLFQGFTSPPPREALLELARAKNATQLPLIQVQCIATDCSNPYLAKDSHNSFSSQKLALGYRLIVIASPPPIINSRPGIFRTLGWKSDIFIWSQTSALWLWLWGRGRRWPEATVQQEQTRWLIGKALGALVKQPNMHSQEEQRQLWRTRTASV